MKKIAKKVLVLALALTMSLGAFGCSGGKGKVPNSTTDIQIYYWLSGLGLEFMNKIVEDFNAKQDKYTATLEYDSSATTVIKTLDAGNSNTYDLYFTMLNSMQYKNDFIKLDDVLDSTPNGETKTIREKYNPALLAGVKDADGTSNFLTYGNGWCGIVYNSDIIDGVNYQIPYTTDELNYLTMDIAGDKSLNVKPWLFFSSTSGSAYWSYPMTAWQVQYDGLDYYNNNILTLTDENGVSPSKEVLTRKDGRYEALKVASQIITPSTVHPESTNTNHTKIQTLFMNGQAAFMPNGSWLISETSGTASVKMMKIPVISSIVDKLEDTSMTDETLSLIVQAVDAGATSSDLCSQNDFNRIKQARNLMYNNGSEQYAFIPKYSNAQEGAKEFLKYFYSDEALATFISYTGCANSVNFSDPDYFDNSNLSDWAKQQEAFARELTAITGRLNKAELYLNTGLDSFLGLNYSNPLSAQNEKDRRTVDQLWNTLVAKVNENWEDWN